MNGVITAVVELPRITLASRRILLVIASMVIFRDPVTPLQAFGYSIALVALIYYKLGGDGIVSFLAQMRNSPGNEIKSNLFGSNERQND
ncbi:hypothetical protein MAP00_004897 [Monascus purpureus]|nr:hypothetical protein MAP00_004897 [Monascus purpureus]